MNVTGPTGAARWYTVGVVAVMAVSAPFALSAERSGPAAGEAHVGVQRYRLFRPAERRESSLVVELDREGMAAARRERTGFRVERFPLPTGRTVDLELERFRVTNAQTRFVVGRRGQADRMLDFDPSQVTLLRGKVAGFAGSDVFLALSDRLSTGRIDLGPGRARFRLSSRLDADHRLAPGRLAVFETNLRAAPGLGVPVCGVDHAAGDEAFLDLGRPVDGAAAGVAPTRGLRTIELAIETDFEFFELFGDLDAANTYVVALYGAVSQIYMRDVNARFELTFVRLWDDPNDLFNDVDPSPLFDFQNFWNFNMGSVPRDVAQLISGRRDYPFGGQAFLSSFCTTSAYSVIGYMLGFFPDPAFPSPFTYDVSVTAHELGHSSGTGHTHDAPNFIDTCNDPNTTPQRGTIMSYCGQTWSGQNANRDGYFHSRIQLNMESFIAGATCVVNDCNMNNIDDAEDVASGTSADANENSVPDECEDCNHNGTLDSLELAGGSPDLNVNGVPDECEPDCNANGVPDDKDIADGVSLDRYGNGVPDECEADCNANGTSDFTEIQANMSLDVDRNAVLDACQDCDADGTPDHDALGGAHNLWIASGLADSVVREFYASTGVLTKTSTGGAGSLVNQGQDVIVAPDGRVLVTSGADDRVMAFDASGAYLGDLVASGAGGLSFPTGLLMAPDGTLLVASRNTNSVLAFDGGTGAVLGAFVAAGSGGLTAPFGLTFGRNGNLFVTSDAGEVLEYAGTDGAFVRVFVAAGSNGGLAQPRGLVFKSDGNLLVASFGTDEVLEFDGQTGAPLGKWAQVGTATRLTQDSPWGIRVGPDGNVFVSRTGTPFSSTPDGVDHGDDHTDSDIVDVGDLHLTDARMYEFDVRTGLFVRTHIGGKDHGLFFATGFAFVPGWEADCNLNLLTDSCDIASGFSADADGNGVPDECDVDCNGNGTLDRLDIIPFGTSFDCNYNLAPDECDVTDGTSNDCNTNGVPDECENDCNGNRLEDGCDISSGTSSDCNANGIPDECEAFSDCNGNGVSDICDIVNGTSNDCNANNVPDDCEPDCNGNGAADECDITGGASGDCNENAIPDECEIQTGDVGDCNRNGLPDECEVVDDLEVDRGWTVGAFTDTAITGIWERVDPNGTSAQPEDDHTPGVGTICFVTGQGPPGGSLGLNDVDGGATTLLSPMLDLSGFVNPTVGYWRWYSNATGGNPNQDTFVVDISNDGGLSWTNLEVVGPAGPETFGGWFFRSFRVRDVLTPTAQVRLRFVAADTGGGSIVEAAIDDLVVIDCVECVSDAACDDGVFCNGVETCVGGLCQPGSPPPECVCPASSAPRPELIQNASGTLVVSAKNRYLSFEAGDAGLQQAVRVTFLALPPAFSDFVGRSMWVGPPTAVSVLSGRGFDADPVGTETLQTARLQCAPFFTNWSGVGMVHVHHEVVVPTGVYAIQVVEQSCTLSFEPNYSAPAEITNSRWADIAALVDAEFRAPDGTVDVTVDVVGLTDAFANRPGAPSKPRVDLEGNGTGIVDGKVNVLELVRALDAFRGVSYPFVPLSVPCP